MFIILNKMTAKKIILWSGLPDNSGFLSMFFLSWFLCERSRVSRVRSSSPGPGPGPGDEVSSSVTCSLVIWSVESAGTSLPPALTRLLEEVGVREGVGAGGGDLVMDG